MPTAASFGHRPRPDAREPVDRRGSRSGRRARRGRDLRRSSGVDRSARERQPSAMAAHLLAQPVGDRRRRARRPRAESMRRGRGMSTGNSSATRPGRLDSSTTRSPRRTASRTLWVTKTTVSAGLAPDPLELVVQDVAGHRVERAERLVHEQHVGVLGERARERDALAHAARQLVRPLVGEAVEVHERAAARRRRRRRSAAARRGSAAPARRCSPTVSHGKSAGLLEHERARRPPTVDRRPTRRPVEAGDQVEQRALAAARGAEQADELARRDVERDPVERGTRCRARRRPCDVASDCDRPSRRTGRRPAVAGRASRIGRRQAPAVTCGSRPAGAARTSLRSVEVVDAVEVHRRRAGRRASRPRPTSRSDDAIGSTVKSRFSHARRSTASRRAPCR